MNYEYFRCPNCIGDIALTVVDQSLACESCNQQWLIDPSNGIIRFVATSNYANSFGEQWNQFKRVQLDIYTGLPISENRLRISLGVERELDYLRQKNVLEVGCGAGRFSEIILGTGANLYSTDYSSAVDANWDNNGHKGGCFFQSDIFNLPLADKVFDVVICIGVVQHTPDPLKAIAKISDKVAVGGLLIVDVYRKSLWDWLQWKYLLRPVTKRLPRSVVRSAISVFLPSVILCSKLLKTIFGKNARRCFPIVEYSELGLSSSINKEWALLDTMDMLTPEFDNPLSQAELSTSLSCEEFSIEYCGNGPNGLLLRAVRIK